jgi:restriction system protein
MPQEKRKKEPRAMLEPLLPFAGVLVVGIFFLPGVQRVLGIILFLALGFAVLSLVIGMALYIRHMKKLATSGPPRPASASPEFSQETWTIELLRQLEWKRFEQVVSAYSRSLGYTTKNTQVGSDGGVAAHLFQGGRPQPVMIMQCKAWDVRDIGLEPVCGLYNLMTVDKVGYGVFYTTGEFSADATEFARGKILDLVDGREFIHRIKQLAPAIQQRILDEVIQGDYTTPTCPGCDIKMVPRPPEDGATNGTRVWICRNQPHCMRVLETGGE